MPAPVIDFPGAVDVDTGPPAPRQRACRHRPVFDVTTPTGFVRYPYYAVREVAQILGLSDDTVRALFRNGRQGRVPEIVDPKPGRRVYRTLLIPHTTLVEFMRRFSKDRQVTGT
jgi:hypothetical protein